MKLTRNKKKNVIKYNSTAKKRRSCLFTYYRSSSSNTFNTCIFSINITTILKTLIVQLSPLLSLPSPPHTSPHTLSYTHAALSSPPQHSDTDACNAPASPLSLPLSRRPSPPYDGPRISTRTLLAPPRSAGSTGTDARNVAAPALVRQRQPLPPSAYRNLGIGIGIFDAAVCRTGSAAGTASCRARPRGLRQSGRGERWTR